MAKWKWHEARSTVAGRDIEALDFGWFCDSCGTDLAKYLDKSGYSGYHNYPGIKRHPPMLRHCPCCGERMVLKGDSDGEQ